MATTVGLVPKTEKPDSKPDKPLKPNEKAKESV